MMRDACLEEAGTPVRIMNSVMQSTASCNPRRALPAASGECSFRAALVRSNWRT